MRTPKPEKAPSPRLGFRVYSNPKTRTAHPNLKSKTLSPTPSNLNPTNLQGHANLCKLAAGVGKDAALPGMTVPGVWVDMPLGFRMV